MCGRVKINKNIAVPGQTFSIITSAGSKSLMWGSYYGEYYNARIENLHTTWKYLSGHRCFLEVDEFIEKDGVFRLKDRVVRLGGIYGPYSFVLLTKPANFLVKPFHLRMPVIVNDVEDRFLEGKLPFSYFENRLIRA